MPTDCLSLKLIKPGENEPELVYVHRNTGKWKSPGEGWLGPQSGVWRELPDGLHLMDPQNNDEVAFCWGLFFDKTFTLEHGASVYRHSGGDGNWEVLGVL